VLDKANIDIIELEQSKFDKVALGSFKDDIYGAMVTMERSLVKADNEMQTIQNYVDKYMPLNLQAYINDFLVAMFDDRHCEERMKLDAFSRELFNRRHDIILHDTGNSYLADVIDEMNSKMQELYDSNNTPSLDMINRPDKKKKAKPVKEGR